MDYRFNMRNPYQRNSFGSVSGRIVDLMPYGMRGMGTDACVMMATVEDEEQNITNFMISPTTYIVDFVTLSVGMMCTFWYRLDVPVPLIYPPQYQAVVVAQMKDNRSVEVSRFDEMLVNETHTLQLNLGDKVKLRTSNNQKYQGNPANHELVVIYDMATRSIPAQTTPLEVIVLCEMSR